MEFFVKIYQKTKKLYRIIGWIILLLFLLSVFLFLHRNFNIMLDSDMSSELILSKLLNSEKNILSKNWYYSTELRVLNTQLVFAPLFSIFNGWHKVRLFGTAILVLILLFSFLYFCKQAQIKYSTYLSLLIVGFTSSSYFLYVIKGAYYIPHLSITFISLGLLCDIIRNDKKKVPIKISILCILAFMAGLGGLRQLMVLYIPLLATSFVYLVYDQFEYLKNGKISLKTQSFRIFCITLLLLILSVFGYLINTNILQKYFSFFDYSKINFTPFAFSKLDNVINGWLNVFGYNYSTTDSLRTYIFFLNAMAALLIVLVIYSCYRTLKNRKCCIKSHLIVTIFFIISSLLMTLLFLFTDTTYLDRYLLPVSTLFVVILGILLSNLKNHIYKVLMMLFLISSVSLSTLFYMNQAIEPNDTAELICIKDILLEHNAYEGFATFWNANILTELSDGKIEVWDYGDTNAGLDIVHTYNWLQSKKHDNIKPSENIFVLLNRAQDENTHFVNLDGNEIIYQSGSRVIYLFKDINDLASKLYVPQ